MHNLHKIPLASFLAVSAKSALEDSLFQRFSVDIAEKIATKIKGVRKKELRSLLIT
jgi:hypothetical protein